MDKRTRIVARESVLVEEYGAMVLGDHVEVLRQGTVGDEACTFLNADDVPRAVKVACQRVRVRSPRGARVPGDDLQLVCWTPSVLVGLQGGAGGPAGRTIQTLGSRLTVIVKVKHD